MKNKISPAIVAIASALFGSICCVGPILAGVAGVGAGAFFTRFSNYRVLFLTFSVFALGYGFYSIYFKKHKVECEDGKCVVKVPGRFSKIALWFALVFAVLAFSFPYLNPAGINGSVAANSGNPGNVKNREAILRISSLDCEACFIPVKIALEKRGGVLKIIPDFKRRELYVEFDSAKVKLSDIVNLIDEVGFKVDDVKLIRGKK